MAGLATYDCQLMAGGTVGTFDFFGPRNLFAKFQRNRFVKSTQLGNFAAELGVLPSRRSDFPTATDSYK